MYRILKFHTNLFKLIHGGRANQTSCCTLIRKIITNLATDKLNYVGSKVQQWLCPY